MAQSKKKHLPQISRKCGTCTACCTTLGILELAKAPGVPCPNLSPVKGCSIYADRPFTCRKWSCMWLRGAFDGEARPDRLGVVMDIGRNDAGDELLFAHESRPGGFKEAERFLKDIARDHVVALLDEKSKVHYIGPADKVQKVSAGWGANSKSSSESKF